MTDNRFEHIYPFETDPTRKGDLVIWVGRTAGYKQTELAKTDHLNELINFLESRLVDGVDKNFMIPNIHTIEYLKGASSYV